MLSFDEGLKTAFLMDTGSTAMSFRLFTRRTTNEIDRSAEGFKLPSISPKTSEILTPLDQPIISLSSVSPTISIGLETRSVTARICNESPSKASMAKELGSCKLIVEMDGNAWPAS